MYIGPRSDMIFMISEMTLMLNRRAYTSASFVLLHCVGLFFDLCNLRVYNSRVDVKCLLLQISIH